MLPLVLAYPTALKETSRPVRFEYVADRAAKAVTVAGTFNAWNATANPMTLGADGRTWSVTLPLPYGKHRYKFVRDGEWTLDPTAPREDDGNGNVNSVLLALPPDYTTPARIGDGQIAASTLRHEPRAPFVNYDRGKLRLLLEARPDDIQKVVAVANGRSYPMRLVGADEIVARYAVEIPWDRKRDLDYSFVLDDGSNPLPYLGPNGLSNQHTSGTIVTGADGASASDFRIEAKSFVPFTVPGWVQRGVMYQIFPDRFENGDPSNDPKDVQPWGGKPEYFNRFGGDVAGVRRHLDHLAGLGVDTVYFNPIFLSPSNHRYDATDYKTVDPQFGTNAEFAALVAEMKARKIRAVLDFAFNHTATDAPEFKDLIANGEKSRFKDWYFPKSYPITVKENPPYEAWYGFPSMPKLNTTNPATKAHLFDVVDYWTKTVGVDGMRLDVGNEVDPNFWRAMRPHLKANGRDKWILGEVWGDGTPWLGGDQWDSVMNYPFREAAIGFFGPAKTSPSQYMGRLMANYSMYVPQVSRNLMNLLGSHDTPRILNVLGKDEKLARLAAAVQFTWPGIPSIYYGDELGMEGEKDPDNRRGMRWDLATEGNPFLARYRLLAKIRRGSTALQVGDPVPLATDDAAGTLAYARLDPDSGDAAIVAINRSDAARTLTLSVPAAARRVASWRDPLSGRRFPAAGGQVIIPLPPKEAAILVPIRETKDRSSATARPKLAGVQNP